MEQSPPPPPDRASPEQPGGPLPGPQTPAQPVPPGPEAPHSYRGPVPPGGWQQPLATPPGWVGVPLASWGSRVGAAVVDWLIVGIPAVILFVVLVGGAVGLTGDEDPSAGAVIGAILLWFVIAGAVALLYAPTLMAREGSHNGQTWGKQMVGIRAVRDSGESMSFAWAALREVVVKGLLVGIASSIIPIVPWLLDVLWPLWDDENRALHDMIVSTHVIRA